MTTIKDSLLAQVAEVLPSSGHKVTVFLFDPHSAQQHYIYITSYTNFTFILQKMNSTW